MIKTKSILKSSKNLSTLLAFVFVAANAAASTCSFFAFYQPEVPKDL